MVIYDDVFVVDNDYLLPVMHLAFSLLYSYVLIYFLCMIF